MRKSLLFVAAIFAAFVLAPAVRAQEAPAKIAIANPFRIFKEMQEVKDINQKNESDQKARQAEAQAKQQKVNDLTDTIKTLKPDSPTYDDRLKELIAARTDLQSWGEYQKLLMERQTKSQTRTIFDKIQVATGKVAERKGYDLVMADTRQDLPDNLDQIDANQLRLVLAQRNVLFNSARVDISSEVIAQLDTDYKSSMKK
jgi:Skp family chaperone for outer membrane proteins